MKSRRLFPRYPARPRFVGWLPRVAPIGRVSLALVGLGGAAMSLESLPLRALLVIMSLAVMRADIGRFYSRIRTRRAPAPPSATHPFRSIAAEAYPVGDGLGWSYGEVRNRIFASLRIQMRGILALVSLLVTAQIGVGVLWLAASPITLIAVEATLWGGIILGLHLGWRTWRLLRSEHLAPA